MNHPSRIAWAVFLTTFLLPWTAYGEHQRETPKAQPPAHLQQAMANPPDDPTRPNVLILGDSISIGYTVAVRKLLDGKADVFRPTTNCAYSGNGVRNVEKWIGNERKWDVIHFNFGIWDSHYLHQGKLVRTSELEKYKPEDLKLRYTTQEYLENLQAILKVLKATDAQLIWATTTPVTQWSGDQQAAHVEKVQAAKSLMEKEAVAINDLYQLALPNLKTWQAGDGCHFTAQGSAELAKQIAEVISEALSESNEAPKSHDDE